MDIQYKILKTDYNKSWEWSEMVTPNIYMRYDTLKYLCHMTE
nr:MAG TPA: hypothetical protein [Caudoviricetes sp.]